MKTPRRRLLLSLAALLLAACASRPEIARIEDPDVDFHAYRTFAFLQGNHNPSLVDRRLLAAARSQLERRGYEYNDLLPDLLVNVAAEVQDRQTLRAAPGDLSDGGTPELENVRLGRMAVDLVDTRREQVVWHGSAEGRVSPAMLRDAGSAVEKAVAAVFEGFPVPAGPAGARRAPKAR